MEKMARMCCEKDCQALMGCYKGKTKHDCGSCHTCWIDKHVGQVKVSYGLCETCLEKALKKRRSRCSTSAYPTIKSTTETDGKSPTAMS